MTTRNRTERVLKDLDRLWITAQMGAIGCQGPLKEKVEMQRLMKAINKARLIVRGNVFVLEDAERHVTNARCFGT